MTDLEVAGATAAGTSDFSAFYCTHLPDAFRLACLLTGTESEAEEVVAEVFARAFPLFGSGSIANWHAYLRRAVVNELHNRRRHLRIRRREEQRRSRLPQVGAVEETVTDRAVVLSALSALPLRQRAAVVLRYYLDMSEAETASVLGISVGGVKSSVSRGLSSLREQLEER